MKRLLLALPLLFIACGEDSDTPYDLKSDQDVIDEFLNISLDVVHDYENVDFPIHYDPVTIAFNNIPENNPVTNEGAQLGRVLFYDVNLSVNNTISCASCHIQQHGFSDAAQFSTGFEGGLTGAHSPRLLNTRYYQPGQMFWDKRAETLEDQVIMPIQDPVEMGFSAENGGLDALINKLQSVPYYPVLFEEAFGDGTVSVERLQKALAQYVRSIVSTNSKFDEGFAQVYNPGLEGFGVDRAFPNFSFEENQGKRIFLEGNGATPFAPFCAGCHRPPTFALAAVAKGIGLDEGETTVYKSPSLKSTALENNFMHDGRFATLEEVVEHYNSGVQVGPATDPFLLTSNGEPHQLNYSDDEKAYLVAFMKTLTDNSILEEEKFSNPFK